MGYHSERGCEVSGVGTDKNVKAIADRYNYIVHIGSFDHRLYAENYFDYVTMDQVIEHISEPVIVLQGISKILRTGGTVILSTPNSNGWGANIFGRKWINWHVPYHHHYFNYESMKILAENSGLVLDKIRNITNSEWLFYQWNHLLMYPEKGSPSLFWSLKENNESDHRGIRRIISYIHSMKLDHVITRLFDYLHIGDNYIFFLRKPL